MRAALEIAPKTGAASEGSSPEGLKITAIARTCLKSTGNDVEAAIDVMVKLVSEQDVLRDVVDDVVKAASAALISATMRGERASIIRNAMRPVPENGKERARALARVNMALLDFPLAGGLRLRKATKREVIAQVALYENHAVDMNHKARWLRSIAERIPEARAVGDVLDEATVASLFREATNA